MQSLLHKYAFQSEACDKYFKENEKGYMMNLEIFCSEYWGKKGDVGISDEVDLHSLIKNYQANKISGHDEQKLLELVICKNGRVRGVWKDVKKSVFRHIHSFYGSNKDMEVYSTTQMMNCCSFILKQSVENCLKRFEPEQSNSRDNQNIFTLLSAFIARSIYYQKIIKEIGFQYLSHEKGSNQSELIRKGEEGEEIESEFGSDMLTPEQEVIIKDFFDKIITALKTDKNYPKLDDFITECIIAGQHPKSYNARQQKKRFVDFLKKKWELDDTVAEWIIERVEFILSERKMPIF